METLFKNLFSKYIIDGVIMDSTPADMLMECFTPEAMEKFLTSFEQIPSDGTIVDETGDADPFPLEYDFSRLEDYAEKLRNVDKAGDEVCVKHPFSSSRVILAETVLKHLLSHRPSRLEGLSMRIYIRWDCGPVGNMAAFYKTVEAVSAYVYDLGIRLTDLDFEEVADTHEIGFEIVGADDCGGRISGSATEGGTLIYVPFDTCSSHKLGGSLFSGILDGGDEVEPELYDPDYFIDSYEVVHDLVEDGIAFSGAVVGRGGLITAVEGLLGDELAIDMDLSGIQNTYMEDDPVRILFSEIPGVVLQIGKSDTDYVDSQFLLQDIAYYPLGSPEKTVRKGLKIRPSVENRDDLSRILSSLLEGQRAEDPEISNFAGE